MADENNPFESPRLLLEGAAEHIERFRSKLEELRATDWCEPSFGEEGETTFKLIAEVPPEMKQITFDVTSNLRSALDHAVFAATTILTGREYGSGTKFPFGDTAKDANDDAKRKCKNVPRELVDYLLTFNAHRSGNPVLWGLNSLRNTKSHRVLIPCPANVRLASVDNMTPDRASFTYEWDEATRCFKSRLERTPGTPPAAVMCSFSLELQIGTGAFRGEPALTVFDRMLSEVDRVVSAIEAETARLLKESGR